MKKLIENTDWDNVSSNLERLPYYAYMLDKQTAKIKPAPTTDEQLFSFAASPNWKNGLDNRTLERVTSIISDYETALSRCRFLRYNKTEMRRRSDIERILYSRGQENDYTVDELYSCLAGVSPFHIHQARYRLTQLNWHLAPPDERENAVYEIPQHGGFFNYLDLFCDFKCGGYRILGDIICDLDDMYRRQYAGKNIIKIDDSDNLKRMLIGAERSRDFKSAIIQNCISIIHPNERYSDPLDYDEAVKCAVALGKRQFALEVLPSAVCDLALDTRKPEPKKKWRLFHR